MRVVFTGHAGLLKSRVLSRFCQYICANDPEWQETSSRHRNEIEKSLACWYEAELRLKPMETFLDVEWREQQRRWRQSISRAVATSERENPRHAFLSLHLSYQWHSGFFSPLSWRIPIPQESGEKLEDSLLYFIGDRFRPDYCVTLIDDIQAVQKRITKGINFRLRELLTWRSFEILLTDLLAKDTILKAHPEFNSADFPFDRSPVVAIRHPPSMLHRLLFLPEHPRIYASYPISRLRSNKEDREEINNFRYNLHRHFAVYDPLTIDERPLQMLFRDFYSKQQDKPTAEQRATLRDRWPIPAEDTLCGQGTEDSQCLRLDEIEEIAQAPPRAKTEIDRTIETRDFRLIDQSDCLVVYRPQFRRGEPSGGTEAEMLYARRTQKPVFLVHDPIVDGKLAPETFELEYSTNIFDQVGNLSDPSNQQRVLQKLNEILKERTKDLVDRRIISL